MLSTYSCTVCLLNWFLIFLFVYLWLCRVFVAACRHFSSCGESGLPSGCPHGIPYHLYLQPATLQPNGLLFEFFQHNKLIFPLGVLHCFSLAQEGSSFWCSIAGPWLSFSSRLSGHLFRVTHLLRSPDHSFSKPCFISCPALITICYFSCVLFCVYSLASHSLINSLTVYLVPV